MTNKRSTPLVSVIIPVFNGGSYLVEAVESVQKSTFKNFEILLIDDGSSDHSQEICRKLEKQYTNVRFFSFARNRGLGRVLNFALEQARGAYICRLNQDDRMLPHRIQTQVTFLEKRSEVVAVGSWIKLFYGDNTKNYEIVRFLEKDEEIKKVWAIISPFSDPSVMYRKEVALRAGGYVQEMWPADDTHLWLRMGKLGQLANIAKPLVEVRYHAKAASVKFFRKLTMSTYFMHLWFSQNIEQVSPLVHLFWIGQFVAGLMLPPNLNWTIYRLIKRFISYLRPEEATRPVVAKKRQYAMTKALT